MKVFKFGGASINTADRIKNTANIIRSYKGEKILVIISAMGKTTNALEKVVDAFFEGRKEDALQLFQQVKESHLQLLKYLITVNWQQAENHLHDFFTEVEWLLHDKPVRDYDYYYDQVVSCGELFSTSLVSNYLHETGIKNKWVDVRDVVRTDDNFRDAFIDWNITREKVKSGIEPLFRDVDLVITQGFIGSTDENESTTLGREGSDFSAAIFANILDAESQTIWKDVEGVMNADPREFPEAVILDALSYREVVEMAYYGAQVIHPKTIKPLENKNIPLHVRCFLKPGLAGTVISNKPVHHLPPVIVLKKNQVLMELSSKDFSFVEEKPMGQLHEMFDQVKIRPNLSQNGAISLLCCLDDKPEKIEKLALAASEIFDVQLEKNLTLLTIRHYTEEKIAELTKGKSMVLEQKTTDTIQVLMR
ncbi:MAG: aspartate kinase [Chitinophagaceae bacterium]|nr:aspartate kinase [Chitinophagaceae bacterium]MBK9530947.1 aspartate kinase [Chitinophagaceae bacterium]